MDLKDKVLKYGSLITVFVMPLLYMGGMAYPQIAPKTFFFYGAVEFLSAFWIYALLSDPAYRISKKTLRFFVPLFAFVAWMTIAGILAVNPHLAFWGSLARGTGLLVFYHALLFSLIVASLTKKCGMSYVYGFMKWFLAGGFLLSISVWLGAGGLRLPYYWLQNDGGGGLSGNSSLAAAYLMFAVAFGVFLLFSQKSTPKKERWFIFSSLAVILFSPIFIDIYHWLFTSGDIIGNARGALLGIFAGGAAAFSIWAILSSKKLWRAVGVLLVIAGLASFSYLWIQLITPGTSLHEKFTQAASGTRFIFWQEAQEAMSEKPLTGYGPENYMIAFQRHFDPRMQLGRYNHETWNDRAHNVYYQTGVDGGYPAIVLYAIFFLGIFFAFYRVYKSEKISRAQVSLLCGFLIGYVIQNLFYFDSTISTMALLALGGMAYSLAGSSDIREEKMQETRWIAGAAVRNVAKMVLLAAFLAFFYFFSFSTTVKAFAYATAFERPSKQSFDNLKRGNGVGEDWDVSGFAHDMYKFYATNPLSIKNNEQRNALAVRNISFTLGYLEWLAKKKPYDYRLYSSIVLLYNTMIFFTGQPYDPTLAGHIINFLDHARELSPTNPEVYWDMAQISAWKGDLQGVINSYEQAINLDPSLPINYELLINFAKAIGNQKLYLLTIAQARKYIPGFSPLTR